MSVGIRELKTHLSDYIARAARGDEIVVTDRGRPVARLVPLVPLSDVDRGIDEGWIEPQRRSRLGAVERVAASRATLDVLAEDRE